MNGQSDQSRERGRRLMMARLDGELSGEELQELEGILRENPGLRQEWEKLQRVKEVTDTMALKRPPEEVWDGYWRSVYNRAERGIGWILVSLGAIVLLGYGLWNMLGGILADTNLPGFVKIFLFALLLGLLVLLVSVIREKLFMRSRDPYKEVER